jgi:hypothetical protein
VLLPLELSLPEIAHFLIKYWLLFEQGETSLLSEQIQGKQKHATSASDEQVANINGRKN